MNLFMLCVALFAALLVQASARELRGHDGLVMQKKLSRKLHHTDDHDPIFILPPVVTKCAAMRNSEKVLSLLATSSVQWEQCHRDFEPVRKFADEVNNGVYEVRLTAQGVENLAKGTAKVARDVKEVAKKYLSKLQFIPKVGKVIKGMIKAIENTEELLERASKKVESVRKIIEQYESATATISGTLNLISHLSARASANLSSAVEVQTNLISCSQETSTCVDDNTVEGFNRGLVGTVASVESASEICTTASSSIRDVFETLSKLLQNNVFNKLRQIVEKVKRALEPILNKVRDIIRDIGKHFSEAYCCVTPLTAQIAFQTIGQVLDLATCPADSLNKVLEPALAELQQYMNNVVLSYFRQALSDLPVATIKVPNILPGKVDLTNCTFQRPTIQLKSQSFLDPLVSIFLAGSAQVEPIHVLSNIVKSFRDDCRDALNEVGKNIGQDCCKGYRPLKDGYICDPLNAVPYIHCSQCSSGKFSFHVKKASIACGIDDTLTNAIKVAGKSIKTGAEAVGEAVEEAVDTVGKGIKNGAEAVGGGVEEAVDTVGKGIKNGAEAVGGGVEKAVETGGKGLKTATKTVSGATKKAVETGGKGLKTATKTVSAGTKTAVKGAGKFFKKFG